MRSEKNDAIFGSLASSAAGNRGHRSVDENYLSTAVAAASKQLGHSRGISIKGWNNSTRASPLWRHKFQDKENGKVVVSKKFRDVQSKLTAPIYSQRRSQAAGAPGLGAGPLQSSSGVLNMPQRAAEQPFLEGSTHNELSAEARVPEDTLQYVTVRRRCEAETLIGFEGPMSGTTAHIRGSQSALGMTSDAIFDETKLREVKAGGQEDPPSPKTCLQATLLGAEQRLAQLTVSSPPANLASAQKAQLAVGTDVCSDIPSACSASPTNVHLASPAASVRAAADKSPPGMDGVSLEEDANSASAASWMYNQEQDPDRAVENCPSSILCPLATDQTSGTNPEQSPSRISSSPQAASIVSLGSQLRYCDSTSAASFTAGTPGLSVLSRSPEAIPFSVWANGIGNSPSKCKPATPSPSNAGAVADDAAAAAAEPHSVTRAAESIAPSPGFSQTRSAGLSVTSQLPQPVAFEAWKRAQRERAALAASVSVQDTPTADGSVVSPASACLRAVKFDCTPAWPPTAQSTPMHPPKAIKPSEGAAGGAQIRSNPLFECDSPASSMTTPLPERTDAMPGLAGTPSPAHKPAIPSLASTPMSDGGSLPSRMASPLGSELSRRLTPSPCLLDGPCPLTSPCLLDGLSPGLFGSGDIGDMPTPVAGVWKTSLTLGSPTELRHGDSDSLLSEDQAPSFGDMPDVAADSCPSPVEPCPKDAEGLSSQAAAEDAAESSPPDMCAEMPTTDDGINTSSDGLAEVPTAEAVPAAADEEGSPISSASASPTAANRQPQAVASCPNDLGATDAACNMGTADVAVSGKAAEVACDEPETEGRQLKTSPERQPENVAPNMARPCSASAASSPSSVAADATKEPASGSSSAERAAAARRDGLMPRAQSYPNTPSAKWPATPTSVYVTPYEEFPTPTSQTSYLSGVQPTAMRRLSSLLTPSLVPASAVPTPAAFTFGLGPVRVLGNGIRVEAPTPDLALGSQTLESDPAGAACSEMATPAFQPARPGVMGFGSPLPLLQLTPLQMRVLDQLASQVIAATSPVVHVVSPASDNDSPVDENARQDCTSAGSDAQAPNMASFAGYNFVQILSHIHSPMPVPMQQQSRRAAAAAPDVAGPVQQGSWSASEVHAEVAIPMGADRQADGAVTAEQEPANANMQPPASPMPSFMKLMSFLNAARRPAADAVRKAADNYEAQPPPEIVESDLASSALQCGADSSASLVNVGDAVAAAAVYSFAQLVAHLRAPKLNGPSGRPNLAPYQPTAASVLSAPACVDSPVTAAGAQDSPAMSEAASFGFSTAAKQMEIRRTPATGTPGDGGVSFMRWARDTPLTFHLDSDAPRASRRGRHARTPSTPVSFSFGARLNTAPSLEEATPAVGISGHPDLGRMSRAGVPPLHFSASGQLSESGEHVSPDVQKGHQRSSSLGLGDLELPGDGATPLTTAADPPAIAAMPGFAAAGLVASPAFSFGPHLGRLPFTAATPAAIFGPRARNNNNSDSNTPDREHASQLHAVFGASPALSLGPWGFVPGRPASADASPTPSELAFTFGHCNAQALATPVWAGLAGAAAAAASALTADKADSDTAWNMAAVLEQVVVAMSPTLFGMGGVGSPADTPGVNQRIRTPARRAAEATPVQAAVPGAAAFWAALLGGGLQSPMPAGIHSRLYPDSMQDEEKPLQQDKQPVVAMCPSLDTVPAVGGASAAEPSPTVAVSETLSAASSVGSAVGGVPRVAAAATSLPGAAATEISGVGCEQRSSQGEAPPLYEDLPDLIARGLCLSASPSVQLAASKSANASTIMTCSSVGENHTPMGRAVDTSVTTTAVASETTVASDVPTVAPTEAVAAGSPPTQRLFRPVVGPLALPQLAAAGASASSEPVLVASAPLVLESVSDSNRSAVDMTSVNVARTTEPLPTPSRMMHTAFSGCNAAVYASAASVRQSPVLSFHAISADRATDTKSPQLMEVLYVSPGPFPSTLDVDIGTASSQCSPITLPGAIRSAAGEERAINGPSSSYKPVPSTMDPPSIVIPGLDSGFGSGVGSPSSDAAFGSTELRCESLPPADVGSPQRAAVAAPTGQQVDSVGKVAPMEGRGTPSAVARGAGDTDGIMQSGPYDAGTADCPAAVCCPSPPPSVVVANDAWQQSPTTFSYLISGTPPATPPTAELASVSKGAPSVAGQQPTGGCGQFWAPSPSGRIAVTSERVMLKASNRRIRTNADLLLDFQGSPGQPMPVNPAASVSGAVTPRMKSPGLLGARSGVAHLHKSWDLGLSPTANAPPHWQNASQASAPPVISDPSIMATSTGALVAAVDATVTVGKGGAVQSAKSPTGLPIGSRARMLMQGEGLPLQQLVAAGIDNAFASAAATVMQPGGIPGEHMPLSRRLGMWPSAVWSVPGIATKAEAAAATEAAAAERSVVHAAVQPQGVAVMPTPKAAPAKPLVASRDVQTTPSLGRCAIEAAKKAPGDLKAAQWLQGAAIAPAPLGPAAIPRPGGFRSRIPAPSNLAATPPSSSWDVSAAPTIARSESSAIPAQHESSIAATSGDEGSEESAPVERVIRRRRLLTSAAAAGGAQRVPVKSTLQRAGQQPAPGANAMAEDEMRRRARVLGVRISPYMKSKTSRVRLADAQQPKKG